MGPAPLSPAYQSDYVVPKRPAWQSRAMLAFAVDAQLPPSLPLLMKISLFWNRRSVQTGKIP
jgi:hypothetical protein